MNEEIKLGFHRMGRALEDPVNLGLAVVVAWAIIALPVTIGFTPRPGRASS